jgi:hypothetical protein
MTLPRPLSHRGIRIVLCAVFALFAAFVNVRAQHLEVAGATAHVFVDRAWPIESDRTATKSNTETLRKHAVLLGNLMTSRPARTFIARRAGLGNDRLAGTTRVSADVPTVLIEPDSERRASDIADSTAPYRIEVQPEPSLPVLSVYAQAPTVPEAQRLADSVLPGLQDYLHQLASVGRAKAVPQIRMEQLGDARGAIVNGTAKPMIALLTFICVFSLSLLALSIANWWGMRRRADEREDGGRPDAASSSPPPLPPRPQTRVPAGAAFSGQRPPGGHGVLTPAVAGLVGGGAITAPPLPALLRAGQLAAASRRIATRAGDWPRTTRILPWMVAGLMAMMWLIPFNVIQLNVGFPIDLTLDRLILPIVFGTWLLAISAGGPDAPRIRVTWIHAALGAVVLAACLSLVIDAGYLNHTLELETSTKKLALLSSYAAVFVIFASVIRRAEVRRFFKYNLILAVLCAFGTLWEYRFKYNIFYSMSDAFLPGVFTVGQAESAAIDEIGRRIVRGPAEISLEAVAMMAMALPIALVGLIQTGKDRRRRVYHVIATALLLAAMVSTFRKSALIAPASVFLTLAYFRRRELIRLAPVVAVLLVAVLALAPGALQAVTGQLRGNKLDVATVSDRSADYDAVRPDVWSHLAFGRGYGAYEHESYRILDMEYLQQLIQVGAFGLAVYLVMILGVVMVARRPIRERRPDEAPVALAAAAAAISFLVVSSLFDVMSFPHAPYIFLTMAAMLAVLVSTRGEREPWSS